MRVEAKGVAAVSSGDAAFSAPSVKIPLLLLSQSGSIATAADGKKQQPLVPGLAGQFTALEVTSLSPDGVRTKNTFPIDDKGMLHWAQAHPLGDVPFEVTLVGKDGAKYSAAVDVSSRAMHVSAPGAYFDVKDIELKREQPPPPATVDVPLLLLSQSGSIATAADGKKQEPLAPDFPGTLTSLTVTAQSPSGTRFQNTFPIDDKGMLHWAQSRPLGDVPFRLELKDDQGNRWRADVDITPGKMKVSAPGAFFDVKNLKLERVTDDAPQAPVQSEGLRNFAAQKPVEGRLSPTAAFFRKD